MTAPNAQTGPPAGATGDAAQEVFTVPVPVHSFPLQDAVPLASIFPERKAFSAATHWVRSLALT